MQSVFMYRSYVCVSIDKICVRNTWQGCKSPNTPGVWLPGPGTSSVPARGYLRLGVILDPLTGPDPYPSPTCKKEDSKGGEEGEEGEGRRKQEEGEKEKRGQKGEKERKRYRIQCKYLFTTSLKCRLLQKKEQGDDSED